ncbi:MAG: fatty acid desaturase [Chitinophagaceae bacterium]|nr:fatty acid desaturase [Chitinophagaceae bacterium]
MRFKAFLLPAIFFGTYVLALFQTSYLLFCLAYIFLGLMLVIIFLNLIHEASHNTLFRGKKNNQRYMLLFDIIGANSYMWNKRHVKLHHNYTNVDGWDSDIEKSKFLKVHPLDGKKTVHHYQHLLIFLYPLFITNWFLLRDFKDFFNPGMIVRKLGDPSRREYIKLFFFKFFFVGYLAVLPALLTTFNLGQTALALFIMLLSAGFFALMVLLPPHVNTSNQFPIVSGDMKLQQSWLMHQLNTTNDVTTTNWFIKYVMANCNFHIAHHLFPNISHVYAKEVTDAIIKYNRQAGLPYRSYPLFTTLRNHYRLIRSNGRWMDILEEDM